MPRVWSRPVRRRPRLLNTWSWASFQLSLLQLLLLVVLTPVTLTIAHDDYRTSRPHVSGTSPDALPWIQRRCREACLAEQPETAADECLTRCSATVVEPSLQGTIDQLERQRQQQQQQHPDKTSYPDGVVGVSRTGESSSDNAAVSGQVRGDGPNNRRRASTKPTGKLQSPSTAAAAATLPRRGRSIAPSGSEGTRPSATVDNITASVIGASSSRMSGIDARLMGTVRPTHGSRAGLEALITWDWPLPLGDVDGDGDTGVGGGGGGGKRRQLQQQQRTPPLFMFTVHWARRTCNVDERFPYCDDPDTYYSNTVYSTTRRANCSIGSLTFNSKYWVEVEYKEVRSTRFTFQTPGCAKLADRSFKFCLQPPSDSRIAVTPSGLLMQPNSESSSVTSRAIATQITDGNPSLMVNVTCLSYDITLRSVTALVTWQRPLTSSTWNSTVMIRYPTYDGIHTTMLRTTDSHLQLDLQADHVNEITVISKSGNMEVIYETRYVNISRDLAAVCDAGSTAFFTERYRWSEMQSLGPLTIAVVGICLIAVFVVLIVGINRCRSTVSAAVSRHQSNLEDKTACSLTKSNSYKSSPSGSPCMRKDEQIQMTLQMKDKWEIDAHDVILGVELGQGAFGLVMTGFYQNTQVAIKVLKGDALPTHRDELLREIKLMKQIGQHPNIVTLVGACTICDPIALIMEYMPYGNLQLVLQKCRMEGSLVHGVEPAVQYCPLDQLTGVGDTKWSLTSGDMLSFARQIALAMEYLTDRKYVHRDLAARNVLVGGDKVVKLCDFGLARLVYSGDQYCKLTNGRLPLKWMALESIRDRVFTAQSDVWSFGVLLWEIATLGASPYANIALVDLYRLLSNGYRLEQPTSCSSELYDIMSQCWCENPAHRPTFSALREQIDELLSHHRNYLDLDILGPCQVPPPFGVVVPGTTILDSDTDDDEDEMRGATAGLLPPGAMKPSGTASSASAVDEYQRIRPSVVVVDNTDPDVHYLQASAVLMSSVEYDEETV